MPSDEDQIRQLVATWHAATMAGDVDTVLGLMTEDVVFLVPGREPMDKAAFAAASRAAPGAPAGARPQIRIASDIEEVQVGGDVAYLRTRLTVTVTPPGGAAPIVRAGRTLSVLRRDAGQWRVARDANLLAVVTA